MFETVEEFVECMLYYYQLLDFEFQCAMWDKERRKPARRRWFR